MKNYWSTAVRTAYPALIHVNENLLLKRAGAVATEANSWRAAMIRRTPGNSKSS